MRDYWNMLHMIKAILFSPIHFAFFDHCIMNLSVGTLMHMICLPADGTLNFLVILKEGCLALAHILYLLCCAQGFLRPCNCLGQHDRQPYTNQDKARVKLWHANWLMSLNLKGIPFVWR